MFMLVGSLALFATLALGVEIANIQGPAWLSPLNGQTVQNVTGIVTAKVCLDAYSHT